MRVGTERVVVRRASKTFTTGAAGACLTTYMSEGGSLRLLCSYAVQSAARGLFRDRLPNAQRAVQNRSQPGRWAPSRCIKGSYAMSQWLKFVKGPIGTLTLYARSEVSA